MEGASAQKSDTGDFPPPALGEHLPQTWSEAGLMGAVKARFLHAGPPRAIWRIPLSGKSGTSERGGEQIVSLQGHAVRLSFSSHSHIVIEPGG